MAGGAHYKVEHWTTATGEANYKNQPAVGITVNDRAGTRQAIINRVRHNGAEFVERSHWAAHKAKPEGMGNDWDYTRIAIHHAGRSFSCGPAALQLKEIQEKHLQKWPDIGYHYAIACSGVIYEGRDIRFKGSHLNRYNTGVIGIVLLENLSDPEEKEDGVGTILSLMKAIGTQRQLTVPSEQKDGLKSLINALREFFVVKELGGHREFPNQDAGEGRICPGNHGISLVAELRMWSGLEKPLT
jgi:hypothetical protein